MVSFLPTNQVIGCLSLPIDYGPVAKPNTLLFLHLDLPTHVWFRRAALLRNTSYLLPMMLLLVSIIFNRVVAVVSAPTNDLRGIQFLFVIPTGCVTL